MMIYILQEGPIKKSPEQLIQHSFVPLMLADFVAILSEDGQFFDIWKNRMGEEQKGVPIDFLDEIMSDLREQENEKWTELTTCKPGMEYSKPELKGEK